MSSTVCSTSDAAYANRLTSSIQFNVQVIAGREFRVASRSPSDGVSKALLQSCKMIAGYAAILSDMSTESGCPHLEIEKSDNIERKISALNLFLERVVKYAKTSAENNPFYHGLISADEGHAKVIQSLYQRALSISLTTPSPFDQCTAILGSLAAIIEPALRMGSTAPTEQLTMKECLENVIRATTMHLGNFPFCISGELVPLDLIPAVLSAHRNADFDQILKTVNARVEELRRNPDLLNSTSEGRDFIASLRTAIGTRNRDDMTSSIQCLTILLLTPPASASATAASAGSQ